MDDFLKSLKKDPLVYYIYQRDPSIYGIETTIKKYIVIVDKDYVIPKDFEDFKIKYDTKRIIDFKIESDGFNFVFFEMQEWFNEVLNCKIIAWECSCLNKKFVPKEHVKLILTVNNSKIRKNFKENSFTLFTSALSNIKENQLEIAKEFLFQILKEADFSNQIINNHKIINFKTPKIFYDKLFSCEAGESLMITFLELYNNVGASLYDNNWEDLLT